MHKDSDLARVLVMHTVHTFPTTLALVQYGPAQFGVVLDNVPQTPALPAPQALALYAGHAMAQCQNVAQIAFVASELARAAQTVLSLAETVPAPAPALATSERNVKIQIGHGLTGRRVVRDVNAIRTEDGKRVGTALVLGQATRVYHDPVRGLWLTAPLSQPEIKSAVRAANKD